MQAALLRQSPNTLRAVIAPKLCGIEHLAWPSGILPLTFSILFSSVSSIAGFSGHANYCAANASLDTYAKHKAACGLPALSMQWGAWTSVGMPSRISHAWRSPIFDLALNAWTCQAAINRNVIWSVGTSLSRRACGCRYGCQKNQNNFKWSNETGYVGTSWGIDSSQSLRIVPITQCWGAWGCTAELLEVTIARCDAKAIIVHNIVWNNRRLRGLYCCVPCYMGPVCACASPGFACVTVSRSTKYLPIM